MLLVGTLLSLLWSNVAAQHLDADLMSFVTLPDVRAVKWEVTHYDRERQAPGYWFVAPYGRNEPDEPTQKFQQYQVGPYIYDNNGILIWAGSPAFDNRNAFDFHATDINGEMHLSFIQAFSADNPDDRGSGVIVDQHYNEVKRIIPTPEVHDFNLHEFSILPGGKTALACTYRSYNLVLTDLGRPEEQSWVVVGGFVEVDLETNAILAEWNSLDHVALHESVRPLEGVLDMPGYDYVHINAVDKNEAGDYIISMRLTDTIYGISGEDGHVMWRLGGRESSFTQDFTFSRQHGLKFVSSNGNIHVISFLNNASDEISNTEEVSSVLYVELNTVTMTARVLKRIIRPDNDLTRLRGNIHTLPNNNTFVGWSKSGYQSEHAPNGDVLMTARFVSDRYSTYRAYKSEFVGRPLYPPEVVASVYGTSDVDLTTVIHVSWNGATDVAGWNFYAQSYDRGEPIFIGHAQKLDFETLYIVDGFMDWITAEAVDASGTSMGRSDVRRSQTPQNWEAVGFLGKSIPSPDDPSLVSAPYRHSKPDSSSNDGANGNMDNMDGMADDHADSDSHAPTYADAKAAAKTISKAYEVIHGIGGLLIMLLVVGSIGGVLAGLWRLSRLRRTRSYEHVPSEEGLPTEEIHLRSQVA
ncbi:uncharacterized protein N7459_006837 [Penicillium hispanicum]|uniref:uncharacterized protein n=1 Tax=Penicillium hispanicum TaxID=1080232 RepID=UPI0025414463|nr:uncharacterized protein N7459_006837 [Penicillium hispanicum]KAJ5577873.1 hypothetical protein N7459_006837 [Penicillium hispanicum]